MVAGCPLQRTRYVCQYRMRRDRIQSLSLHVIPGPARWTGVVLVRVLETNLPSEGALLSPVRSPDDGRHPAAFGEVRTAA